MKSIAGWGWVCAGLLAGSSLASAVDQPPASQPESVRPGRWHYYVNCEQARMVAFDADSLWFQADKVLWRYDLKTRAVRAFSPLDGPPGGPGGPRPPRIGGFVAPIWCGRWVWLPKQGWTPWADLDDRGGTDIALGPDGTLYRSVRPTNRSPQLLKWSGRWEQVVASTTRFSQGFVPLADGYYVFGTGNQGVGTPMYVDATGEVKDGATFGVAGLVYALRLKGKTYVVMNHSYSGGKYSLYEIVGTKLVERTSGDLVGVDLAGRGFLKATVAETQFHSRRRLRIETEDGRSADSPWHNVGLRPMLCRDGNGDIWFGPQRWDGKDWQLVAPMELHCPLAGNVDAAADPDRATLDPRTMTWTVPPTDPHGPVGWHEPTKTGWYIEPGTTSVYEFQLVRQDGDKREVLHRHASGNFELRPFRDAKGQWWWAGRDAVVKGREVTVIGDFVNRLTHAGLKKYPYTLPLDGRAWLVLSPKDTVWLFDKEGWSRFDEAKDKFVPGEPWEDFAFRFGPWTLSRLAGMPARFGVRWKVDGDWLPFDPLGTGGQASGGAPMIHGQRMAVHLEGVGACVYDAAADRWVLLSRGHAVALDPRGRVLLGTQAYRGTVLLVLDGDPFEAQAADFDRFGRLLARLDDPDFKVRQAATADMAELADVLPLQVHWASRSSKTAPEARARLQQVARNKRLVREQGGTAVSWKDLLSLMAADLY